MSKPFQFSMSRMFGAVALLGLASQLGMLFVPVSGDGGFYTTFLFTGIFAASGAAIGCLTGRPFLGALCGILLGLVIGGFLLPSLQFAKNPD